MVTVSARSQLPLELYFGPDRLSTATTDRLAAKNAQQISKGLDDCKKNEASGCLLFPRLTADIDSSYLVKDAIDSNVKGRSYRYYSTR